MTEPPTGCTAILLAEVARAVHADEYGELVWQALICAYLDHAGWRQVAEALFVKHGYTVEEITSENSDEPPTTERSGPNG